jgi:AraC family transcriptional regulator, arabinose operon regulatory protein
MENRKTGESIKNIWYGLGKQRIEIPRSIIKNTVQKNPCMCNLYVSSLGYYPKAAGHYTYRKNGLPENFLFYCVDGEGQYRIGKKEYKVSANQFFMLPQNVEHAYGSSESNPWTIYWIHYGGTMLPGLNSMHGIERFHAPTAVKSNDEAMRLYDRMYKTLELGYSIDNLLFVNLSLSHFLSLFMYNNWHFPSASFQKGDIIQSALLYMQQHVNDNISLKDLCRHYNYSVSRFSSLFKQSTGYSPIDYFIQMKMQKASQQLNFTNLSVKAIAMNMGFDDPYYFSRRFRKIMGSSPKIYRETQ